MLVDRHDRLGDLLAFEETPPEDGAEFLDRPGEVLARECVDGVLHRVGRNDEAVVAVDVGARELALDGDRDREITDPMSGSVAHDLDEPNGGLAVAIRAQLRHAAPTRSCSRRYRSRAIATTSPSARRISAPRSASSASRSTRTSSDRERPATKTQKRKPNR